MIQYIGFVIIYPDYGYINLFFSAGTMLMIFIILVVVNLCAASTKKGVAINGGNSYHCGDEDAFNNIHWW